MKILNTQTQFQQLFSVSGVWVANHQILGYSPTSNPEAPLNAADSAGLQ